MIVRRHDLELPFVVESKAYYYATNDFDEALYLVAYLNAKVINSAVKPFQSKGQFGERDIHKKILEFRLPKFTPHDELHQKLVGVARCAVQKAEEFILGKKYDANGNSLGAFELGRVRNEVREVLAPELAEIDVVLGEILRA